MQEEKFLIKIQFLDGLQQKVIRHGIKQSQHGQNNVRKTGGKPSNRREEISRTKSKRREK